MAASGPGIREIKLLFARSSNRCAFPRCRAPIALDETLAGEVCHIKGARPRSARYDASQTDTERHAYENLILMCPTHHTVIDDDEEAYTVERLRAIKASHEAGSVSISDAEASLVANLFIQSATNSGQNSGLLAHTVNAATITLQSAPSTSHLTRQRQIQAVEHLWQVVRNLNTQFSLVIFVDDIFTREELDSYFREGKHAHAVDCIREYADWNLSVRKLHIAGTDEAARERPFVTQRLWLVFTVLQGIYGRSALLLSNSYKDRRLVNWRMDSGCDQLLRAILPAHAVERAKGLKIGGLRAAVGFLESQFLAEAGMNRPCT